MQDNANALKCEHFLSRDKCLKCLPSPFTYSYRTIYKTRDRFINWTCGKLSDAVQLLIQKLFWASDEGFQIFVRRSPDMISPFHSNLKS